MDLKGSLIDTNLRIYPSHKLKSFLKNEPFQDKMPINIAKVIKGAAYNSKDYKPDSKPMNIHLNTKDIENLTRIAKQLNCGGLSNCENGNAEIVVNEEINKHSDEPNELCNKDDDPEIELTEEKLKNNEENKDKGSFLTTSDIDWLYMYIKERKNKGDDIPYLHELLEGSDIELPENAVIKRNPVLEARCVKLRAQQEAREYRKMTKGVDNVRMRFPEDSISYQLKQMNRQLIAIGQFIISIFAGFLFGFRGIEWMVGNLDFGFRLLLGVMCALIIALAEIYFLAKKLNEELSVPETTQLGGPPNFADERFNGNRISKTDKPHID